MFSYKSNSGEILMFNLKYVLYVRHSTYCKAYLEVMMVDKCVITLVDNWEDRNDVARFKQAMTEYSGVKWDE